MKLKRRKQAPRGPIQKDDGFFLSPQSRQEARRVYGGEELQRGWEDDVRLERAERQMPRVEKEERAKSKKNRPVKKAQAKSSSALEGKGLVKARSSKKAKRRREEAELILARQQAKTQERPKSAQSLAADLAREAAIGIDEQVAARALAKPSEEEHYRYYVPPRYLHMGILVVTIVMLAFGLVMLFSASMTNAYYNQESSVYYLFRQVVFTMIGVFLVFVLSRINPKSWNRKKLAILLYLVTTFLLVIVLIPGIGIQVNGQRRWLPLFIIPNMTFQPSEIAKLATVFCGAVYFSDLRRRRSRGELQSHNPKNQALKDLYHDFLVPTGAVFVWCFLISRQSHMSSILIILLTLFVVYLSSGIRLRSWAMMGSIMLSIIVALAILFVSFRPQIEAAVAESPRLRHLLVRMNVFSGAVAEDSDENYQSAQALIGIGSGGLTGVGLGLGRQKFNWLPEIHNDYVYSNICEELGFVGGASVILLFLLFFLMGIQVTLKMQSVYLQIMAAGFSSLIAIQAFLSIAVNLKVIPPTGISLPLFSYGGTSNLFFLAGIGLLLACSKFGPKQEKAIYLPEAKPGAANATWRPTMPDLEEGGKKHV